MRPSAQLLTSLCGSPEIEGIPLPLISKAGSICVFSWHSPFYHSCKPLVTRVIHSMLRVLLESPFGLVSRWASDLDRHSTRLDGYSADTRRTPVRQDTRHGLRPHIRSCVAPRIVPTVDIVTLRTSLTVAPGRRTLQSDCSLFIARGRGYHGR